MKRSQIHKFLLEAHKRGVKQAEELSIRTGVPLVVEENGQIFKIYPKYEYVRLPIKAKKKKRKRHLK